jgi:methylase of polypeptide subunit release factors
MRNSDSTAEPRFETDLEKTAQEYASRFIAGWEAIYPRMPTVFLECASALVPTSGRALELGCGDGKITSQLAQTFDEVCVVDGSLRMLDACREGTAVSPRSKAMMPYVHSTIELIEAQQQ